MGVLKKCFKNRDRERGIEPSTTSTLQKKKKEKKTKNKYKNLHHENVESIEMPFVCFGVRVLSGQNDAGAEEKRVIVLSNLLFTITRMV